MKQGMVQIDTIVREALADKGYDTPHLYAKYLMWALRVFRELNLDHTQDIKTVELPVSVTKTVRYPDDYVTYNKLGVKIGDRMWTFVRDNTITSHKIDKYTANKTFYEDAQSKLPSLRFFNFFPDFGSNLVGASTFNYIDVNGYAHNGVGYFKPVDSCREFQLSSEVKSKKVILEYVFNNFNPDTETFVTLTMKEVVRQYIHYQDAMYRQGTSVGLKREAELDYLYALSDFDRRLSDLSFQGILNALRINTTLAIKG